MFKDIKNLLPKSMNRSGLSKKVRIAGVLKLFQSEAKKILNKDLAEQIKPLYIKHGVLTVATLSSLAAKKLQEHEKKILRKINMVFEDKKDEKEVEKIKYLT
jgi:predicted nucleic acid-binding Zn ribbon protein